MNQRVREHVPAVTGVLTVVSLALVFGAVLGVGPARSLPRAPDAVIEAIPHVNAVVSLTAIGTILAGVRAIRRREVERHRRLMVGTFVLFATFLVLYLYRVSVVGTTAFAGPDVVYTYVYLPVLAVHILLAIVAIPLVYYVLLLAATHSVRELPRTNHPRAGKLAASLWLVSFALGTVVYLLLYWVY